jgi:hypothetical protein
MATTCRPRVRPARFDRSLAAFALVAAIAPVANATWSIVVTDSKTGEIAVATATCIVGDNIKKYVPVIRVGFGAAACQAQIDQTAKNRKIIFEQLPLGTDPAVMLQLIQPQDAAFQSRQIGIVDLKGRAVTFTGANAFAWAGGVTGSKGSMTYSIQGNILTGAPVVDACEAALLTTGGDLADKVMAAMEAARAMGGDGRCSCSPATPTACGAPPPSFTKSAHIGCVILARVGDLDGICGANQGCATGSYYLNLNVAGSDAQGWDPDPVFQLQDLFATWRESWIGRPDHLKSEQSIASKVLPADGVSTTSLRIRLRDWQGSAVPLEGASIQVTPEGGDQGVVAIGSVVDEGLGIYSIPLTSKLALGKQALRVVVDDGISKVTLYPFPEVATAPAVSLTASSASVSTLLGGDIDLAIDGGPGLSGRQYLLLASASGSTPPTDLGPIDVPLVADAAFAWSFALCNSAFLVNSCGQLDVGGGSTASLHFPPLFLRPLHQGALTFAFVTLDGVDYASNPIVLDIGP